MANGSVEAESHSALVRRSPQAHRPPGNCKCSPSMFSKQVLFQSTAPTKVPRKPCSGRRSEDRAPSMPTPRVRNPPLCSAGSGLGLPRTGRCPLGQKLRRPAEDVADSLLGASRQQAGCYGPSLAQGALMTRGRFLDWENGCCSRFGSPSLKQSAAGTQTWQVGRGRGGAEAPKLNSGKPLALAGPSRRHQKRKQVYYPGNVGRNSLGRQPAGSKLPARPGSCLLFPDPDSDPEPPKWPGSPRLDLQVLGITSSDRQNPRPTPLHSA